MKEFACVECVYIGGQRAPTTKDISIFCEPERISANGYLFTADGDKYKRSPPESALPRGGSGGDPATPLPPTPPPFSASLSPERPPARPRGRKDGGGRALLVSSRLDGLGEPPGDGLVAGSAVGSAAATPGFDNGAGNGQRLPPEVESPGVLMWVPRPWGTPVVEARGIPGAGAAPGGGVSTQAPRAGHWRPPAPL
ncbi:hypothetical protein OsJ_05559 [Oryza sativa Japonica Group]|uniref:Uncharacterized protein n=1 Tax=Oryza sativa subsp. japonica TaxID=39947 RepID=B9F3A5_ORYSJ|nr:hypothetical protein OsJ_05559 [Oryza sativa Japonica Group]